MRQAQQKIGKPSLDDTNTIASSSGSTTSSGRNNRSRLAPGSGGRGGVHSSNFPDMASFPLLPARERAKRKGVIYPARRRRTHTDAGSGPTADAIHTSLSIHTVPSLRFGRAIRGLRGTVRSARVEGRGRSGLGRWVGEVCGGEVCLGGEVTGLTTAAGEQAYIPTHIHAHTHTHTHTLHDGWGCSPGSGRAATGTGSQPYLLVSRRDRCRGFFSVCFSPRGFLCVCVCVCFSLCVLPLACPAGCFSLLASR